LRLDLFLFLQLRGEQRAQRRVHGLLQGGGSDRPARGRRGGRRARRSDRGDPQGRGRRWPGGGPGRRSGRGRRGRERSRDGGRARGRGRGGRCIFARQIVEEFVQRIGGHRGKIMPAWLRGVGSPCWRL
jgi:hypothetical protein